MNLTGRFPCPACKDGFIWKNGFYDERCTWIDGWKVSTCDLCAGHKVVIVKDGRVTGPDAPPRYLCDHGKRLTDDCTKCDRTTRKEEFKTTLNLESYGR